MENETSKYVLKVHMAKRHKYRKTEASDFFDYSEGILPEKERNAFERLQQKDAFEAEAAEGLSMLSRDEAENDLQFVSGKINRRIKRNRRVAWIGIAAALVSILTVTTIFINVEDTSMDKYKTAPQMKELVKEKDQVPDSEKEGELLKKSTEEIKQQESIKPEKKNTQEIINSPEQLEVPTQTTSKRENERLIQKADNNDVKTSGQVSKKAEISKIEIPTDADQVEEIIAEDNAFAWETMEEEASGGRYDADKKKTESLTADVPSISPSKALSGRAAGVEIASQNNAFISGNVRSAQDLQPLPGVNIIVQGSSLGTVTDINGDFKIETGDPNSKAVVASYIGMESEEFIAEANTPIEIAMLPSTMQLEEVVVTGYGTSRKELTTTSVSEVKINDPANPEYISAAPEYGIIAYRRYIDTTLVYPEDFSIFGKAVVVLKFTISPSGRPQNFTIIKTPSPLFSREAIRVIETGPDWLPAKKDDAYWDEVVRMRVVFK